MAYVDINKIQISKEFEDILTSLSKDDYNILEKSLLESGFNPQFGRIKVWFPDNIEGIGYIIDGHNRYKMCQELGIKIDLEKNVEEIELGDFAEEIDAMDWMLTHQLSSKNLTVNERIAMVDDFKEEVRLENERKKISGNKLGTAITNGKSVALQLECEREKKHSDTWTDSQTAKKAGVGVGTVARYNKVMNSNEEDLKEKVKTGQVTVNKAYEEVRKRETRVCKTCGKEKKIIDFFGNDTICKECSRKESEKNINAQKSSSSLYPANDMQALATYVELKGYKNGEHGDKLCQNGTAKSSLDEIAKELNISKRNLQRALRIERNLTDSMKELLDTGEITKTFASDTIASLS